MYSKVATQRATERAVAVAGAAVARDRRAAGHRDRHGHGSRVSPGCGTTGAGPCGRLLTATGHRTGGGADVSGRCRDGACSGHSCGTRARTASGGRGAG